MCKIDWSKPLKYVGGPVHYNVELLKLPPRHGMNNSRMKLITLTQLAGGHVIVCAVNDDGYEIHPTGVIAHRRIVENAPEEIKDHICIYDSCGMWVVDGGGVQSYDWWIKNTADRELYRNCKIVKVK